MLCWEDHGIVLTARPHGETAAVVTVLTAAHGRHAGLLAAARGRGRAALCQPGSRVVATWQARLAEHLGIWSLDLQRAWAARLFDQPGPLAMVAAACAVCETALPEREPCPAVYAGLQVLLELAESPFWAQAYVRWEVEVLAALGFALELDVCALTGQPDDLAFVSPRSGRAVSRRAAAPFQDRLLPLPAFLGGRPAEPSPAEPNPPEAGIAQGLALTGHFLNRHVFRHCREGEPPARRLLQARFDNPASGIRHQESAPP